ncbi:MAG TPA: carboxypeptidase-like regulatory domain-containing protein, partial [Longimicrobiales bacterium]|nr:carboxypeptidase-like regulatory domain-containing protein [Longimicrobiales bacterium]
MKPRLSAVITAFLFVTASLLITSSTAFAQMPTMGAPRPAGPAQNATVITGTVSDTTSRPLSGAAVTIKVGEKNSTLTGTMTDPKGKFKIEGLAPGKYRVHFSYIGFKSVERDIELTAQASTANVGTIKLI